MDKISTPRGTVTIRPALSADAAQVRSLRLEALANHPEAFAADYAITQAENDEAWLKRIAEYAQKEQGVICIATVGDQLVGMIGLIRGHWPKTRHNSVIWGVYVQPAWRGLLVAKTLVQASLAWAQAHGVQVVKLAVVTSNTAAVRLYALCGFRIYGLEPRVIYYGGDYYDELLVAKLI